MGTQPDPLARTMGTQPSVMQLVPQNQMADTTVQRRGKAPPIDSFTGENAEICFDDWIPTLERAATWNNWTH